jgi:demethylmenaquinone methyltransferase/2-methoxy-6-polyprenyl-1,4-benzoquinol methylase
VSDAPHRYDLPHRRPRNRLFDLLAPAWESLMGAWGVRRVIEALEPQPGQCLVDVGGGVGRLARHLPEGTRSVVVDPSGPMVLRGRRRGRTVVRASAEAIPLASETADAVVVLDAFHHMENLPAAAAEIGRVLAPGGRAVLFEPDPQTFAGAWVARLERWTGMGSLLLDADSLSALFAGRGLHVRVDRARFHLLLVADHPQRRTNAPGQ